MRPCQASLIAFWWVDRESDGLPMIFGRRKFEPRHRMADARKVTPEVKIGRCHCLTRYPSDPGTQPPFSGRIRLLHRRLRHKRHALGQSLVGRIFEAASRTMYNVWLSPNDVD